MGIRVAVVTLVLAGVAFGGTVGVGDYTGSRTVTGGGLEGVGSYETNFKISWVITVVADTFTYKWTLSNEAGEDLDKGVSHSIFETSTNFTATDILAGSDAIISSDSPKTFTSTDGNSNPLLPADLFGIKFEVPDGTDAKVITHTLVTKKIPIWGNFYVKDGRDGTSPVAQVWNRGFLLDSDVASNAFFVPTPDTIGTTTPPGAVGAPLPAGAWLGMAMLAGLALTRRLRRRR